LTDGSFPSVEKVEEVEEVEERGLKRFYCHCPGGTCTIGSPALRAEELSVLFCAKTPIFTRKNYPFIYKSIGWHFGGIRPSKYTFEVISVRYTKFRFWGRRSESLLAG
jgi:hypothetical protein